MSDAGAESLERRVLVVAPTSRDADLTRSILDGAGVVSCCYPDVPALCDELKRGAGAVLMAEEATRRGRGEALVAWLAAQPPWSDLPVLVLARPGADSADVRESMDRLGNVIVLERPTRVATLVSAVRTALRARQRQYQIRDALEERLQADRRKDEFLATLAHELRNPLAPIRNALHLLRLNQRQDSGAAHIGEVLERQVNLMVRLVDDLMEISRITRGKIELRKEPVEISTIIRGAVETSRPLIDAAGHDLEVALPTEPLILEGDAVRLTQVVSNLLNNAAKYTETAGRIVLAVRRDGDGVSISVRDNGMGIPPDQLPRIFDLFMQVDRHAGRAQGGLGIGLTLVKSLVEMHGGTVLARSEGAGRGTEFTIRLPLALHLQPPARLEPKLEAARVLLRRSVLVVDDNRDAADSLGELLRLLGADVHVAYSGAEALEAVATHRPAVVLLDLGMPGMDGYEVARRIRQNSAAADAILIALTGWGQEGDRNRSERAGFDHHLVKPADVQALETLLTSLDQSPRTSRATPRTLQS